MSDRPFVSGRSRRPEGRILVDTNVPWGHQVAVMFQIVSALALEVPAFLQNIENIWGVSPDVQLSCEPWGYVDHSGGGCECLSSDRTGAYVHGLSLMPKESGIGAGRPGSVSFVSHRPGAYGRLLLAVYVWWKMGLLVESDWLHPVTRGAGRRAYQSQHEALLTSAD